MSTATVRTHDTNAGSVRAGDVIAEGFAGYSVLDITNDGTRCALALRSLQTGSVMAWSLPPTATLTLVHHDDHGRPL